MISKIQLRLKKGFYFVSINAKGGEHWTWCYGAGIDVKEGQYDQCWRWYYGVFIDVNKINMVLSLYVFEILNLKRDNVVGYTKDIAQGA
jgi:hypothetical protein